MKPPKQFDPASLKRWVTSPEFLAIHENIANRVEAGERITAEQMAAELALPWEAFAILFGTTVAERDQTTVVIGDVVGTERAN